MPLKTEVLVSGNIVNYLYFDHKIWRNQDDTHLEGSSYDASSCYVGISHQEFEPVVSPVNCHNDQLGKTCSPSFIFPTLQP